MKDCCVLCKRDGAMNTDTDHHHTANDMRHLWATWGEPQQLNSYNNDNEFD